MGDSRPDARRELAFGTDYKFTGKELDKETGLYYFGARYYDPRTQVWQSPDPILSDYLGGINADPSKLPGMGGVYNPPNLNLYAYSHNNPVNLVDPDGLCIACVDLGDSIAEIRNNTNSDPFKGENQIFFIEAGVGLNVDINVINDIKLSASQKGFNLSKINIGGDIAKGLESAGEIEGVASIMIAYYFKEGRIHSSAIYGNSEIGYGADVDASMNTSNLNISGYVDFRYGSDANLELDDMKGLAYFPSVSEEKQPFGERLPEAQQIFFFPSNMGRPIRGIWY
ncbi:RHS repeat-associated core domain-containing protein [Psychrobacter sp. I-STPA6b]|uniref:RHS repeat-associated core domain-containing protein n=1 Tax=Psychrobacter sp. I-STPA6b TaxID=2585718 RepID=UPI001D0CDC35|nr:RHS repeat-associated core domain-containing protein [Psychrobacter sp. I-STPA6b]